jgi:hypothetical protein
MRARKLSLLSACVVVIAAAAAAYTAVSMAGSGGLTNVPTANTRSQGYAPASVLSPELQQVVVAQGSTKLENPMDNVSYHGYDDDLKNSAGQPVMVASAATLNKEAHKTEPDKNTYLVFDKGLTGAEPSYKYGTHFLFQGHEGTAPGVPAAITRINLDADAAHRVTLLATRDDTGAAIRTIDGSTWDPWAKRLLFTTESRTEPTYSATPGYPSQVHDVSGALGRGGYEGIQDDSDGNIWIVEDIGGAFKGTKKSKVPNSFVYRYVPEKPGDLAHGKLQALQVLDASGDPITETDMTPLMSQPQIDLHTYGKVFNTQWVTIHDTKNGRAPFDANNAARAANATPFKRPENGQFRPGSHFQELYFDETGDTDAGTDPGTSAPENDCCGGWGSLFKLTQSSPSADTGKLTLFYKGDQVHAGFDNTAFVSKDEITFVEDAGDTLHRQRNALDSGWLFDANTDYSDPANRPLRWLAEGRDASATLDADNGGFGNNEGDNEITGIHVSDGDPSTNGVLGQKLPHAFQGDWRVFYTQQHGDNATYEVLPK